jgi:hypothetical protein
MGSDRKRMKRIRQKRIDSINEQIEKHNQKIETEKGRKDTTKDYWKKEIDEKFMQQIRKDRDYLEENNSGDNDGDTDKEGS